MLSTSTLAAGKRSSRESTSTAVAASSSTQLSALIDSADYAPADKEALIAGLRVAAPFGSTRDVAAHVSQQTIDLQVKKSSSDLQHSIGLIFDVAKCLEQNRQEFIASPDFQRLPSKERSSVSSHLETIAEQYSARALETLFAANGRTINVPANVSRSASDPDYQQLLVLTARVLQQSKTDVAATPAKRVVPPAETSPAPAAEVAVSAPVAPVVEAPVSTPAPKTAAPAMTAKPAVVAAPEPAVAVTPVVTPAPEVTPASTVAPAPAPVTAPAVAAPAPATETYTLKSGDSLAFVARLKKVSIQALLEANPDLTPSHMRVGQTLVIPSGASTAAPARRDVTGDKNTAMLTPRSTGQ